MDNEERNMALLKDVLSEVSSGTIEALERNSRRINLY